MYRFASDYLNQWLISPNRKPLIMRGARQVGKTWLIRHLAQVSGKKLLEINFENNPSSASLFNSNKPQEILLNLSSVLNQEVNPEDSLLFLDEIQAAPQLIGQLRWFAEDMPKIAVVAAGSLLEFVLAKPNFSVPVGRVSYMHIEPFSFEEFLIAKNKSLYNYLKTYEFGTNVPKAIHEQLNVLFKEYLIIGGMPGVLSSWFSQQSIASVNLVKNDLLTAYRDDFNRYNGRIPVERIDEVMLSVPKMLSEKFVYKNVNTDLSAVAVKKCLELLENARICSRIKSCSANGVPLAAEVNEKYFKEIFLDVGLCSTALGLNLIELRSVVDITLINNGGLAEQFVGQQLRAIEEPYIEPVLYYWRRDETGSSAEIDYITQHNNHVLPLEVKAGSTGSLKSLHLFMNIKQLNVAVRVNSDYPSNVDVDVQANNGKNAKYKLLSIPFYLLGQLHRLVEPEYRR